MNHESICKAAQHVTYGGAVLSAGSAAALGPTGAIPPAMQERVLGLTMNQWSVLGIAFGMLMALCGVLVNVYFQRKRLAVLKPSDGDE